MTVVDAHHHLWDPSRREYPWMGEELASIRRPFSPVDLRPLLVANGVDRSIVVQTISSPDETREFLATAATSGFISGVVGWADLTDPSIAATLRSLKDGPGGRFLVGIRHQVHDEPDPRWLQRDDVARGLTAIGDAGLVYDVLVRTRELPAALAIARRFPEIRFVIDHMAKPRISAGPRDLEWERSMAPLSDLPNVSCKISGLVTEARWDAWTDDDLAPYIHRAIGWFGPERCMFGSDWPVCLLAATYEQVMRAARHALVDLNESELDGVFGGNAVTVYGLGDLVGQ